MHQNQLELSSEYHSINISFTVTDFLIGRLEQTMKINKSRKFLGMLLK